MPPSPEQLAPSPHRPPPQNASPLAVCLTPCADYGHIKAALDHNLRRLGLERCFASSRVLLKPNLVAARKPYDPACTDPRFVRAAAELVLDYGGRPLIGDSPAFASAQRVMGRCHMTDLLADLAIEIVEFEPGPIRLLPNGQRIRIARQAAECDLALNMPKVKAHSQLLVTLAVKNLFGFVVGIRKPYNGEEDDGEDAAYPTLAEIASNVLSSIFLDSLDTDLERLERINKTISLIPDRRLEQGGVTLRPIDVLTISPSQSLDRVAGRHAHLLPRPLRYLLRGVGAYGRHGATLLSYLLFERAFCRDLIALGYHDAMARRADIIRFLELEGAENKTAASC